MFDVSALGFFDLMNKLVGFVVLRLITVTVGGGSTGVVAFLFCMSLSFIGAGTACEFELEGFDCAGG